MKSRSAVIAIGGLLLAGNLAWGQGEAQAIMVLQRARGVSEKNNQNQQAIANASGATPGAATPAQPAAPAAPVAPKLTPDQQALVGLNTAMQAIKTDVKPAQVDSLADALAANAHGAKPSGLSKLSASLAAALANKTLSNQQRGRIEQDIIAILNDTTMPMSQYNDVIADVPAVLKRAGVDEKAAAAVGADLKAIGAEVRRK